MSDSLWPHDCSPPGFSVLGISQARILGWIAISSSRGSSQSGDWTHISCISRRILYHWATWKAHTDTWKRKLILGMGSHAYGSPEVPPSALCKLEAWESQGCKSGPSPEAPEQVQEDREVPAHQGEWFHLIWLHSSSQQIRSCHPPWGGHLLHFVS